MRGHVVVTFYVHKDGRITDIDDAPAFGCGRVHQLGVATPSRPRIQRFRCRPSIRTTKRSSPSRSTSTKTLDDMSRPNRSRSSGGCILLLAALVALALFRSCSFVAECDSVPQLVAILGPTADGKSALGIRARASDSTGKLSAAIPPPSIAGSTSARTRFQSDQRGGIPHHLIDVADPTEEYSAARYAREAAAVIRDMTRAWRLPILVGGTGLYYRALTRGFFPGLARDTALAGRAGAHRRTQGAASGCIAVLARVDDPASQRIQPRDRKRLIRALEVYLSDRAAAHCALRRTRSHRLPATTSSSFALRIPAEATADRVAQRVDAQFEQGLLDEIRGAAGGGRAADRPSVHRPGLSPGTRASARRPRRGRDARTDRAREQESTRAGS